MTERLYYSDSYLHLFQARIVERLEDNGRPAVVLDRSAFYPTSGGQPADRGWLNQTQVIDVIERESDGEVLHVLSEPVAATDVLGAIDLFRSQIRSAELDRRRAVEAVVIEMERNGLGFERLNERL